MRGLYLGVALFLLCSPGSALAMLDEPAKPARVAVDGDVLSDDELVSKGGDLLDHEHYDEAIQVFNQVLERSPRNGAALAGRGFAYAHTNRLAEATRELQAAEAVIPDDAAIDRLRGLIAHRRSDYEGAMLHLSKSLEKEPGNPFALRFRAYLYQREGNEVAALADAEAYIKARPDDPDPYVLKADLLTGQGKRDLAGAEGDRLLSRFAYDAYAVAAAARIFDGLGDRDRAMAAIDKAVTLDPDHYYYRSLRAGFRRWDDFAGRRADLDAALERDPNNAGILTELGLLEFRERHWRKAAARFSEVLALEPKDFGLLAYRSMAQAQAGNRRAAAADYEAALAAASGANDFNLVCWAMAREGLNLRWALDSCDRAVKLMDREGKYRANRGLVKLRLGQLDEALADFNLAVEADDESADGYYGRALVHQRLGDPAAADKDLRQALALNHRIDEEYQQYGLGLPRPTNTENRSAH